MELFRTAASALERQRRIAWVTVVATTGSTPGKVGYKMLVCEGDAEPAGTVGGGLLEARMIEEARRMLDQPQVRLLRFNLGESPDDAKGICGGSVEFLIETFDLAALPLFKGLAEVTNRDDSGVLVSIILPDGMPRKIRVVDAEEIGRVWTVHQQSFDAKEGGGQRTPCELPQDIADAVKEVAATGTAGIRVSAGGVDAFVESLARQPTVVLLGAGHVASHIARYARSVHFGVVVCDDRAEYANRERFPDADEIIVEDFGRVFDRVRIDDHSYVVIVTRGHKCDQIVLEQAVRREARYLGMIGSRRKTLILLQKLRDKGVPKERLERVYSPIGVSIGAVTAEEIALSVVCELVKIRRLGDAAGIGHMRLSKGEGCL